MSGTESGAVRADLKFGAVLPATAGSGRSNLVAETAAGVMVEEVKLLVSSVRFHNEAGEGIDFKSGPFVVTIDPQSTAGTVAVEEIPPGTYDRVTFQIHKPENDETVPDPAFHDGERGNERYSMVVRGSYLGLPFTVNVSQHIQQQVALDPPLRVEEGDEAVNVTLLADVSSWFIGKRGETLNPSDTSERNVQAIEKAIRESFRALGTKRDNGRDDDGGDDDDDDEDDEDDD